MMRAEINCVRVFVCLTREWGNTKDCKSEISPGFIAFIGFVESRELQDIFPDSS